MKRQSFIRSLTHAFQGIAQVAKAELSFRIQIIIGTLIVILIFVLDLATWERILLILMVAAVLVLEIMNTIFERLSDALKPRLHPMVKDVKDMMAGAVLITAITAATVAILIFSSYLF